MHITTVVINSEEWIQLEDYLSQWLGVTFTFDPTKTYRIQNISNMRIMFVESEAVLANVYREGEVILPYQTYTYVPYGSPQHLYVRGGGHYPLKLTVTEANGGTIQNIEQKIGDIDSELETV